MTDRPEGLRQLLPPVVELRAVRRARSYGEIERELALLGHANLLGTGEPVRVGADRHRARCIRRHLQPHQHRIIPLEHVIHQAGHC